jgi:hypothetical protein
MVRCLNIQFVRVLLMPAISLNLGAALITPIIRT